MLIDDLANAAASRKLSSWEIADLDFYSTFIVSVRKAAHPPQEGYKRQAWDTDQDLIRISMADDHGSDAAEIKAILSSFFDHIGFDLQQPQQPYPVILDRAVRGQITTWEAEGALGSEVADQLYRLLPTGLNLIQLPYRQASLKLKVFLVLHSILLLRVDGLVTTDPGRILPDLEKVLLSHGLDLALHCPVSSTAEDRDARSFGYDDPCLGLCSSLIAQEAPLHFGPYSTGAISKGFIEFVMGNIIEARFPGGINSSGCLTTAAPSPTSLAGGPSNKAPSESAAHPSHPPLAEAGGAAPAHFLRIKTGIGEPYAHFIFPSELVPEDEFLGGYFPHMGRIVDFINFTNDVLSFYKEYVLKGEENTYILNRARQEGRTPIEILRKLSDEVVELSKTIREGLAVTSRVSDTGFNALTDLWDKFINGYLLYHTCSERYRLRDLGFVHKESE